MGVERRGNSFYYYRKKRIGKRTVSLYGGGDVPFETAERDALIRAEKQAEQAAEKIRRGEFARLDDAVQECGQNLETRLTAFLLAEGYHRTPSREWRRKRQ